MSFGRKKMDHPPSPVLVTKLSRSLQARKRKQKSYVVKNKSSNHLDNVIEKNIADNNDIITNTVKEIENCLQIVKSSESQFTLNDAEILNNNLESGINSLQEIQGVIERENNYLDISLAVQNNVLNFVQSFKSHKEEKKSQRNLQKNCINVSFSNVASTSKEKENNFTNVSSEVNQYSKTKLENKHLLTKTPLSRQNSILMENDMIVDDCSSDQDLLEDGNDSKISNLVNTIISGTKVYSSTPVQDKYQNLSNNSFSKLNTPFRPKSINISESSLKSASKLFEDIFESPTIVPSNGQFRKNVNKKSLNFTESDMDEDCFYSDITDTQMNQIVDEAIVITKSEKLEDDCFNGFENISVNHSQEFKEFFEDNLHQWRQSVIDLSENSQTDFKGFHQVDICHKALHNINLEIERLKRTLPKAHDNKLKRIKQHENISDKCVKKYRYDSCNDPTISKDVSNKTRDLNNVLDIGFHSASNKHIEIKNSDLSRAQNLFNDLDDYGILLKDNKLTKKAFKLPFKKSECNISRNYEDLKNRKILQHSEPSFSTSPSELRTKQTKLSRLERHELTLQNLAEMEKSFKAAENVFTFNTDTNKNKKTDSSKAFFEFHDSFNEIVKDKGDSLTSYESINEETKTYSMNTDNAGFQTASNKQVKINNNSLGKVQNVFSDIDGSKSDLEFSSKTKLPSTADKNQELCFRTASNKKCKINEDVLRNVDILFKDINEFSTDIESNIHKHPTFDESDKTMNKNSKVDTLKEFNLIDNTGSEALTVINQNCDFQTASSKKIKTNEKSLKTAQILFKDLESDSTATVCNKFNSFHANSSHTLNNKNDPKKSVACDNFGFSTASNKKLEAINEKALENAKSLFKDIVNDNENIRPVASNNSGFSRAANKKLEAINEKALENAKSLFEDIVNDNGNYAVDNENIRPVASSNFGFSTASNKKIEAINEKALEKAENLFKGIVNDNENIQPYASSNFGFSTASNKKLEAINVKALEKAESLFKDIDENISIREDSVCTLGKHPKQMLISGNFKVDKNSLSKAHNLFKDIFDEYSNVSINKNESVKSSAGSTNITQNKDIYDELENAVMCFENMDETMLKIPTSDEIQNSNEKLNSQLEENKKGERKTENENEEFLGANENHADGLDNMSSRFSIEDNKSEYSDADETLIEDTDDFTDAGSVGSKSDSDNVVLCKDTIKLKQHEFNTVEAKLSLNDGKVLPSHCVLNMTELMSLNQNYLNEPSISLRQPSSGDLKQWGIEVKKQITDLNMLVKLLEKKNSHIEKLMNCDSKNQTIKGFTSGKLYNKKQKQRNLRVSLRSAVNNRLPLCSNDLPGSSLRRFSINLWDITPENACDLHFYLPSPPNQSVISLSDDVKLVPSSSYFAGLTEFKIAFETMPGVDKKKIIGGWFDNHFRWIVWKLASMDRQFPNQFQGYFLTPDNLMQQLKYRYDRDIYGNERSAIRKITERDDVPSRRMVLCVNKIVEISTNNYEIELCDGWYSLKASIDLYLMNLIRRNKIQVGSKLITYGAELLNVPEPCHPLQVQQNARLKIHGNSTRRVKWDTKLGFQRVTGPFRTSVQSIQPFGGYVGRVLGFIARTFPLKYVEKMDNEQWVCRCKRAEARRDRAFQTEQEKVVEKVHQETFESLQNQWHAESLAIIKENKNSGDIQKLTCPKKLLALLEFSTDPSSISELLSKSQLQIVTDYRTKLNSQRQADISSKVQSILNNRGFAKRTVSSILQIVIVDACKPDLNNYYILEIWNPDNFILDTLTENSTINFLNLISSNVRGDNNSLKATKQTRYLKVDQQNNINYKFCLRHYTPIRQMQLFEYNPTLKYCDTVGVIVKICSEDNLIKYVWLADAHFRLLRIMYKMDSSNCLAFEGFHVGDIVAVFNLKLSKCLLGQAQAIIDFVTYVTKSPSKSPDMTTAIEYLQNELPSSFNDFICDCDDKISQWNDEMGIKFY